MIFFDLDGTLLDHDSAIAAAEKRFYEEFGNQIDMSFPHFLIRWGQLREKHNTAKNLNMKADLLQRRTRMRELFSEEFTDDEADRRFEIYMEGYRSAWVLYSDVIPTLERFQNIGIGLITNGTSLVQREKIMRTGLEKYFKLILISEEVGVAKPSSAIFEMATQQGQYSLSDCTYVGDRLDIDAIAAKNSGMCGIWLNRTAKDPSMEVRTIHSLSEL
jgi:putative hydrolase of the HAD superfamily